MREGRASSMIAKCKLDCASIGSKFPRPGHAHTQLVCPLCPAQPKLTLAHVVLFCPIVEKIRKDETSLTSFRDLCRLFGIVDEVIFHLVVNGLDHYRQHIPLDLYLARGRGLQIVVDAWLFLW